VPRVCRGDRVPAVAAETNVVVHARTGVLWARLDDAARDLQVADEGPPIPDVSLALREGWSTASSRASAMRFGAGMGLSNIRRNSDRFEIETRVGRGTRIRSTLWCPAENENDAAHMDRSPLGDLAAALAPVACTTPEIELRARLIAGAEIPDASTTAIARSLPAGLRLVAALLPPVLIVSYFTGVNNARVRFRRAQSRYLRQKMVIGVIFFCLSAAAAALLFATGPFVTWVRTVDAALMVCCTACAFLQGRVGGHLMESLFPWQGNLAAFRARLRPKVLTCRSGFIC